MPEAQFISVGRSLLLGTKKEARRDSSLILGTKNEHLLEGQFACGRAFAHPGNKEGGPAGGPARLWGQRRSLLEGQFACLGTKKAEELLPENPGDQNGNKEGRLAGGLFA